MGRSSAMENSGMWIMCWVFRLVEKSFVVAVLPKTDISTLINLQKRSKKSFFHKTKHIAPSEKAMAPIKKESDQESHSLSQCTAQKSFSFTSQKNHHIKSFYDRSGKSPRKTKITIFARILSFFAFAWYISGRFCTVRAQMLFRRHFCWAEQPKPPFPSI